MCRRGAKIGARCGFDAEGAVAVGHDVEVAGEDLVFGEVVVQLAGHLHLAEFACVACLHGGGSFLLGVRVDQVHVVLHVLLVERGCTPADAAGKHVGGHRAKRPGPVHAVVVVEASILDGYDRVLHRLGDLVCGDIEAPLFVDPGDGGVRVVVNRGHTGGSAVCEIGESCFHGLLRSGRSDP